MSNLFVNTFNTFYLHTKVYLILFGNIVIFNSMKTLNYKRLLLFAIIGVFSFGLMSCSKSTDDYGLFGWQKIWYPAYVWWDWQWGNFTPNFWSFVERIWGVGGGFAWFAGILVNILAAILYVVIIVVLFVLWLVFSIILAIIWFLIGLVYGFWHWDGGV